MGKILESIAEMMATEIKASEDKILGSLPSFEAYQKALGHLGALRMIDQKIHEIVDTFMRSQDEF